MTEGHDEETISKNIQEMISQGHSPKRAVSSAMESARKSRMASGGMVMKGEEDPPQESIAELNEMAEQPSDEDVLAMALGKHEESMDMGEDEDDMSTGGEVEPKPQAQDMSNSVLTDEQKKAILEKKKNRIFKQ